MGKQTKPAAIIGIVDSLTRQDAEELYGEIPKHKLWDTLWSFMDRTDCAGDDKAKIAAIWQSARKR